MSPICEKYGGQVELLNINPNERIRKCNKEEEDCPVDFGIEQKKFGLNWYQNAGNASIVTGSALLKEMKHGIVTIIAGVVRIFPAIVVPIQIVPVLKSLKHWSGTSFTEDGVWYVTDSMKEDGDGDGIAKQGIMIFPVNWITKLTYLIFNFLA